MSDKFPSESLHKHPFALHNFCTYKKYLWGKIKGDIQMNKNSVVFKNKKWIIAIAVVITTLVAVGIFANSTNAAGTLETAKVVSMEMEETLEASGTLESQPFASLNWKTAGIVATVKVKPGQMVKEGDILLTLQPNSTSASIASAQADLIEAQQNLEDLTNSDSELAQAIIDLRDAQREFDDKSGYLHYLQTSDRVPLTETVGWYEKGKMGGWVYESKTRYYKGPATKDLLTEAENNLELARAELEDIQRKVEQLQNKEQDTLAAQARVDAAQATVNSMKIIAPFDGKILSVDDHLGDTVTTGDLSVNIADMNHLYIETQVDESDIAKVKLGNQAEVTVDALPEISLRGKVSTINPVGEVISGLVKYKVRIDLDKVDKDMFLPLGTTANVVIKVSDEASVLAVPITAIQNDSKGEYVWVIRNGEAERVEVVGGAIVGELGAVTGNLTEGETLQIVNENSFEAPNPFGGKK
jgi:HlyD family secretion protein